MIVADVYKGDVLAGTIARFDDRAEFAYVPAYDGEAVASSLPVVTNPYIKPAGQLPAFFFGLLPEGRRLAALLRVLKVSADDELSMLLAVGSNLVGDVRVIPTGESPPDPVAMVSDVAWSEVDLQALFDRSIGADYDTTAIPGVQDKISGSMISFPVAGPAGSVIIKLNPPEYARLVANESAMLDALASTGLGDVPRRLLIADSKGVEGLVVDRFDRQITNGTVVRHPVEDGCQALDRYPADRYNMDTVEVIAGLADRCSAPPVARLQLLNRFLASYLALDGDLHARNMAIYRSASGLWEPTPVYDVVCTAVYGDMVLAAPFNGRTDVRSMGRRRFVEAGIELGLPTQAIEKLLDKWVPLISGAVMDRLSGPTFATFPDQSKAVRMVERRTELLLEGG